MDIFIAFSCGAVVGALIGVLVMALLNAGKGE